jgi:hypothetical protein
VFSYVTVSLCYVLPLVVALIPSSSQHSQAYTSTACAALVGGEVAVVVERPARLLQLKLACRSLRQQTEQDCCASKVAAADASHVASQFAALVRAMKPAMGEAAAELVAACSALAAFTTARLSP